MITVLSIIAASIITPSTSKTSDYKVMDAMRTTSFAGKLGSRVEDTLVLDRDGAKYTVKLGYAHTRFGKVAEFHIGDNLKIARQLHPGKNTIMRDEVVLD